MVFKNFTGDISTATSLTSNLTLLGKSFKAIGEDYKTLQAMGDGKAKSLFNSIVSSSDTVALKKFHQELKAGKSSQVAYDTTMLRASETAQKQARTYNTLTRNLQRYQRQRTKGILTEEQYNAKVDITKAKIAALGVETETLTFKQKALAVATNLVSNAFNMVKAAIATAVTTLVISGIITAISSFVKSQEEAAEPEETYDRCMAKLESFGGNTKYVLGVGGSVNQIPIPNLMAMFHAADNYKL